MQHPFVVVLFFLAVVTPGSALPSSSLRGHGQRFLADTDGAPPEPIVETHPGNKENVRQHQNDDDKQQPFDDNVDDATEAVDDTVDESPNNNAETNNDSSKNSEDDNNNNKPPAAKDDKSSTKSNNSTAPTPTTKNSNPDASNNNPQPIATTSNNNNKEALSSSQDIYVIQLQAQQRQLRLVLGLSLGAGLVAMIVTAWQMSDHPDGCYANLCRAILFGLGILGRVLLLPCSFCCCWKTRHSRHAYGHVPSSSIMLDYGFREPVALVVRS